MSLLTAITNWLRRQEPPRKIPTPAEVAEMSSKYDAYKVEEILDDICLSLEGGITYAFCVDLDEESATFKEVQRRLAEFGWKLVQEVPTVYNVEPLL